MKRIATVAGAALLALGVVAGPALADEGNHYGENAKILCSIDVDGTPVWEIYGHKNLGQCVKVVVATQKAQAAS